MTTKRLPLLHPGKILREEYLVPFNIRPTALAKHLHLSPTQIRHILQGNQPITANIALRLARFFNTSEMFWLNLQMRYDLESEKERLADKLEKEINVFKPTSDISPEPL
jgi:addiction module HigA family antidote